MDIASTTSIITGAAGGIGAAIAEAVLAADGSVVLTDLDSGRLAATGEKLAGEHGDDRVAWKAGDAASEDDLRALIALADAQFGEVDLFFANAGIGLGAGLEAPESEWDLAIDVNLRAHVRAARLLVPGWLQRGHGYFVSTASAAGLLTQLGSPTYAVTKHAAVGFAEWLAVTYGDRGIGVSCLCPMGVDTDLLKAGTESSQGHAHLASKAVTTAGEVLSTEQVARDVLAAIEAERFLILPHAEVLDMYRGKGADYDRWIAGMNRYRSSLEA